MEAYTLCHKKVQEESIKNLNFSFKKIVDLKLYIPIHTLKIFLLSIAYIYPD